MEYIGSTKYLIHLKSYSKSNKLKSLSFGLAQGCGNFVLMQVTSVLR